MRSVRLVVGMALFGFAALACGSDGGGSSSSSASSSSGASGTTAATGNSCAGLPATCGGSQDCCASAAVPGGTFNRSNDPQFPATVAAFKLDVYEVTIGRFRNFVNAGKGTQGSAPAAGQGAHPTIPNSGWNADHNQFLAADTASLVAGLKCTGQHFQGPAVWTDAPGPNENKPVACVTWYEAAAFCAWDGGRLPTEAEWSFAAAGGAEQRDYPWGADIDPSKAVYDCRGDGSGVGNCTPNDLLAVGSKPAGNGKFGHADLAGNVWEYVLDRIGDSNAYKKPCDNCAELSGAQFGFRGGAFVNEDYLLKNDARVGDDPAQRDDDVGFRCARNP